VAVVDEVDLVDGDCERVRRAAPRPLVNPEQG
jgi:hypothetical protein